MIRPIDCLVAIAVLSPELGQIQTIVMQDKQRFSADILINHEHLFDTHTHQKRNITIGYLSHDQ